ncbi:Hypothetical predicted protein [Cloeon dipterum]|uniref:Uncharacterized protein n=1 Tax=Cloeon dipterum TaxID=197152 RepID=A0A8S1BX39_9INSE|nr:Hypothetical predicted protein [Cloeon dipterum]
MSAAERKKIYKQAGDLKLEEWSDDTSTSFLEELAADGDLSDAFRSFVKQNCGDGPSEAWELLRKGTHEPSEEIRQRLQTILNQGGVRVLDMEAKDFDNEDVNWCEFFKKMTTDLRTKFPEKPCLDAFRAEVSDYRKENKPSGMTLRKRFARSCSLF